MIWKPNVTVAAIVKRDQRFLLVEEEVEGRVVINQPAGHLDEGESLLAAVVRETREETACDFVPEALLGVYRWINPDNGITYLRFAFTGRVTAEYPEEPLDEGILRALWLTDTEVAARARDHRSPQVRRCVDDYTRGVRYPLALLTEMSP